MRKLLLAAMAILFATSARAQDPQDVLNYLLQQQMQRYQQQQQNEAMRLELERRDLERQLRYRRMSDSDVMTELMRFCPNGSASCVQAPPEMLVREAASRGLIELRVAPPSRQGNDCMIIGLGDGDGILDCQ